MREEMLGTRLLELVSLVEKENPRKISEMLLELSDEKIVDLLSPTVCGFCLPRVRCLSAIAIELGHSSALLNSRSCRM